ncbi:LIV-I protein F OS=Afipia felis OX=1035 GN=livF_1 PE=3 SV=1 [Afipia felis]
MTETILNVDDVCASYGESQVLYEVSLHCEKGSITGLLGRNGVGKSTTLKSIMGLVSTSAGSIRLDGEEVRGLAPYQLARRGIGFVPEERQIFPTLTVLENLQMGCRPPEHKIDYKPWTIREILEIFPGLERRKTSKGEFLSGGEQQMLSLGRALVGNPRVLLVDDPSEGLAPVIVEVVEEVIRAAAERGVSVLLVESKLAVVQRLANKVYVMSKGAVVHEGTSLELQDNAEIRRRYLEV